MSDPLSIFGLTDSINLLAAIVTILGGILAIYVIVRQRQFYRSSVEIFLGRAGSLTENLPDEHLRKYDRKQLQVLNAPSDLWCRFYDKKLFKKVDPSFSVIYYPISIKNKGKKSATNLQIHLEYPADNWVDFNKLTSSLNGATAKRIDAIGQIEGTGVATFEELKSDKERVSFADRGSATTILSIPVLRPGEGFVFGEPIRLPHNGYTEKAMSPRKARPLGAIYRFLKYPEAIPDFFEITAFLRGDDLDEFQKKGIIMSIVSDSKRRDGSDQIVTDLTNAFWFGAYPLNLRAWRPALIGGLFRYFNIWHSRSDKLTRQEPFMLNTGEVLVSNLEKNVAFQVDATSSESFIGFGMLNLPNVDLFSIPNRINSTRSLLFWMGFMPIGKLDHESKV